MIGIIKFISLITIIYLAKVIVFNIIRPISNKRIKRTRSFILHNKKRENKEKLYYFKDVILRKLAKKTFISHIKRAEYEKMIKRLELKTTPEEIRAKQVLMFAMTLILALLVMRINSLLGYLSLIAPFLAWLYPIDEMEKKIEAKNKNIMQDFPGFYSLLYYQYSRSVDIYLADVVKDFLPNANPDMSEELGVFIDNIEYGEEYALKQFKKRVPMKYIIKFCDIMQTRLNGYNNTSQMAYLKNELHDLRLNMLEKELKSRETKSVQIQFILVMVLLIYVIIYFYFQFMSAIKLFN